MSIIMSEDGKVATLGPRADAPATVHQRAAAGEFTSLTQHARAIVEAQYIPIPVVELLALLIEAVERIAPPPAPVVVNRDRGACLPDAGDMPA